MGWRVTDSCEKNLLFWCDNVGVDYCLTLHPWQFVNHFPGTFAISRKVELSRNYDRAQKLFPEFYNFHPFSFILPAQLPDMQQYMRHVSRAKRTFIVKPDLGAQGHGIFLVQDADNLIGYEESAIAQHYIPPYLLNGVKFDFRIYALLTSINPLRIYIYNEGMARFCTEPYRKPRPSNLSEVFSHLTNYSLNKKNEHFQQPTNSGAQEGGHKRSLSSVFAELAGKGVDIVALQARIDELIVLTVLCAQPFIAHNYRASIKAADGKSRCFEILGFDVLLDKRGKPWLLEVNHSPSLLCESSFDKELKDGLITGAMTIIDLDPSFKKKTTAHERARTMRRISGQAELASVATLWSAERESEIAARTGWRLIHPDEDPETAERRARVLEALSADGSVEKRRDAARIAPAQKEKENEKEKKKQPRHIVGRTPRSQLLLRETKLAKLRSDTKREQAARVHAVLQPEKAPQLATQQLIFAGEE
jgi:tubulin polyglutamylase TTLL6/13